MPKNIYDLQKEFYEEVSPNIDCTDEVNKEMLELLSQGRLLPDGITRKQDDSGNYLDVFTQIDYTVIARDEARDLMMIKMLDHLKTIKNCLLFFSCLTLFSIVIYVIILLASSQR